MYILLLQRLGSLWHVFSSPKNCQITLWFPFPDELHPHICLALLQAAPSQEELGEKLNMQIENVKFRLYLLLVLYKEGSRRTFCQSNSLLLFH